MVAYGKCKCGLSPVYSPVLYPVNTYSFSQRWDRLAACKANFEPVMYQALDLSLMGQHWPHEYAKIGPNLACQYWANTGV